MEIVESIPVARYHREGDLARVEDCPYCHKRHTHGVRGESGGLSHRIAHCAIDQNRDPRHEQLGIGRGYFLLPEGVPLPDKSPEKAA